MPCWGMRKVVSESMSAWPTLIAFSKKPVLRRPKGRLWSGREVDQGEAFTTGTTRFAVEKSSKPLFRSNSTPLTLVRPMRRFRASGLPVARPTSHWEGHTERELFLATQELRQSAKEWRKRRIFYRVWRTYRAKRELMKNCFLGHAGVIWKGKRCSLSLPGDPGHPQTLRWSGPTA